MSRRATATAACQTSWKRLLSPKRKLPEHASGSYIYLSVSEPGVLPEDIDAYRKLDFSSNARHKLQFSPSELGKQANVYVRYSNQHGKEGPAGPVETFFIN